MNVVSLSFSKFDRLIHFEANLLASRSNKSPEQVQKSQTESHLKNPWHQQCPRTKKEPLMNGWQWSSKSTGQ